MSGFRIMPETPTVKMLKAMTFAGTDGSSTIGEAGRMKYAYAAALSAAPAPAHELDGAVAKLVEAATAMRAALGSIYNCTAPADRNLDGLCRDMSAAHAIAISTFRSAESALAPFKGEG